MTSASAIAKHDVAIAFLQSLCEPAFSRNAEYRVAVESLHENQTEHGFEDDHGFRSDLGADRQASKQVFHEILRLFEFFGGDVYPKLFFLVFPHGAIVTVSGLRLCDSIS